jgi:hypothetical protein
MRPGRKRWESDGYGHCFSSFLSFFSRSTSVPTLFSIHLLFTLNTLLLYAFPTTSCLHFSSFFLSLLFLLFGRHRRVPVSGNFRLKVVSLTIRYLIFVPGARWLESRMVQVIGVELFRDVSSRISVG